jgi:hypothetical protein
LVGKEEEARGFEQSFAKWKEDDCVFTSYYFSLCSDSFSYLAAFFEMDIDKENGGVTLAQVATSYDRFAQTADEVHLRCADVIADAGAAVAADTSERLAAERMRYAHLRACSMKVQTQGALIEALQTAAPFASMTGDAQAELDTSVAGVAEQAAAARAELAARKEALGRRVAALTEGNAALQRAVRDMGAKKAALLEQQPSQQQQQQQQQSEGGEEVTTTPAPGAAETKASLDAQLDAQLGALQQLNERKEVLGDKAGALKAEVAERQAAAAPLRARLSAGSQPGSSQPVGTGGGTDFSAAEVSAQLASLQQQGSWYEQANATLGAIAGVRVGEFTPSSVTIELPPHHRASIKFQSPTTGDGSCKIVAVSLAPLAPTADARALAVPIDDLAAAAGAGALRLPALVRELRARAANYGARRAHLAALRERYHVDYDEARDTVTFTLPIGVVATVGLTRDYPAAPAGAATIAALDGVNGWSSADLRALAAELNASAIAAAAAGAAPASITELARVVELRLAAMDQSQTPKVILNGKLLG